MPVFKVIPVMSILFLIRKKRETEKKKAIAVAIMSRSESQKEPTKDPLLTDGPLLKGNQGHSSQKNSQSAEMQRSTI